MYADREMKYINYLYYYWYYFRLLCAFVLLSCSTHISYMMYIWVFLQDFVVDIWLIISIKRSLHAIDHVACDPIEIFVSYCKILSEHCCQLLMEPSNYIWIVCIRAILHRTGLYWRLNNLLKMILHATLQCSNLY